MKETNLDISIIIPVYNSAGCLEELHAKICNALKDSAYEIIFVNDCSKDESWEKIISIADSDKKIKAINFSKNFGQNHALLAGLKNCSGQFAVIMDDDGQHDPTDILPLINECKKGFDVCFARFDNLKQKGWKNAGSNLNGKIAEWFIGKPKEIYLSPFVRRDPRYSLRPAISYEKHPESQLYRYRPRGYRTRRWEWCAVVALGALSFAG